jgi:hypothetical protein
MLQIYKLTILLITPDFIDLQGDFQQTHLITNDTSIQLHLPHQIAFYQNQTIV